MQVMDTHNFFDADIVKVLWEGHINNREIVFKEPVEAMLINKEDAIALAKEFNLVVYEKDSCL